MQAASEGFAVASSSGNSPAAVARAVEPVRQTQPVGDPPKDPANARAARKSAEAKTQRVNDDRADVESVEELKSSERKDALEAERAEKQERAVEIERERQAKARGAEAERESVRKREDHARLESLLVKKDLEGLNPEKRLETRFERQREQAPEPRFLKAFNAYGQDEPASPAARTDIRA